MFVPRPEGPPLSFFLNVCHWTINVAHIIKNQNHKQLNGNAPVKMILFGKDFAGYLKQTKKQTTTSIKDS